MSESITPQQDHDRRIGRLEGITEQLDHRFEAIDRRFDAQDRRFDAQDRRFDAQDRALAELRATNRWIIGILFGVVGLQITILLKAIG